MNITRQFKSTNAGIYIFLLSAVVSAELMGNRRTWVPCCQSIRNVHIDRGGRCK